MGGRGSSIAGRTSIGTSKGARVIENETFGGENIIKDIAELRKQYKYVGIRTQEEPFELGQMSHKSSHWVNGDETNKLLDGVSATSVKSSAVQGHSDSKKDYSQQRKYGNHAGYYYGNHVAIIVGNEARSGADQGEIIIKKPKVKRILK